MKQPGPCKISCLTKSWAPACAGHNSLCQMCCSQFKLGHIHCNSASLKCFKPSGLLLPLLSLSQSPSPDPFCSRSLHCVHNCHCQTFCSDLLNFQLMVLFNVCDYATYEHWVQAHWASGSKTCTLYARRYSELWKSAASMFSESPGDVTQHLGYCISQQRAANQAFFAQFIYSCWTPKVVQRKVMSTGLSSRFKGWRPIKPLFVQWLETLRAQSE